MLRKTALAEGETYHIYNRGAHKGKIFTSDADNIRFMLLLHLCNSTERVATRDVLSKYQGRSLVDIFAEERPDKSLVDILAYCLMPNHYHIILRQKGADGITKFMNRLGTAYSMYFNKKYEHSGVLFQGRFKSSHINSESYFRYIFAYVHLNPLDLMFPNWSEDVSKINLNSAREYINEYQHSSFVDYIGKERPETNILARSDAPEFLTSQNDLEELLESFTEDRPR